MSSFTHYSVKNQLQSPILKNTKDLEIYEGSYLNNLRQNLKFDVLSLTDDEIVFDLIGVDASLANALRRIFLAEVLHYYYTSIILMISFLCKGNNGSS